MDDSIELIIYGIVMLISIVGMVAKAKKQAKTSRNAPAPASPWDEDEYEYDTPLPQPFMRQAAADTKSMAEPVPAPGHEAMREMVAAEGGRMKLNPKFFTTAAEEDAADANASHSSELLREFDLRKAVVYAEILKPKFTDY